MSRRYFQDLPLRIYLVDDDPIDAFVAREVIRRYNPKIEVVVFHDAKHALRALAADGRSNESSLPNVILLDLHMPEMDGWDFIDQYVQLPASVTGQSLLYLLSASINAPDLQKARMCPLVTAYWPKPFTSFTMVKLQGDLERVLS